MINLILILWTMRIMTPYGMIDFTFLTAVYKDPFVHMTEKVNFVYLFSCLIQKPPFHSFWHVLSPNVIGQIVPKLLTPWLKRNRQSTRGHGTSHEETSEMTCFLLSGIISLDFSPLHKVTNPPKYKTLEESLHISTI